MIFIGNTNVLEIQGLKLAIEDTIVTDATVTVTGIEDCAGVHLAGTFPISMDYVADAEVEGTYRAILVDTLPYVERTTYFARVFADAGTNRIGRWKCEFRPTERTE